MHNQILIVGQTPPPYYGQAISIQRLLDYNFPDVEFVHIRLSTLSSMAEIGKFDFRKVFHTLKVIGQIYYYRLIKGIRVLYYPPAVINRHALMRDLLILISTRWLFDKIIFHFHAANFELSYQTLTKLIAKIFLKAFSAPDVAICKSKYSLQEIVFIKPKRTFLVPNGLPDMFQKHSESFHHKNNKVSLLYVGALYESKGVFVLLEACKLIRRDGISFELNLVGQGSDSDQRKILAYAEENGICTHLHGVLTGEAKWLEYAAADIFCFPTYFEAENLPLVLIEAMMFGLPVVSTNWHGIPDLITDGVNGFLVPIKDPVQLADRLKRLILDRELRLKMGKAGRERYLKEFTLERERANLYQALKAAFDE